MRNAHNEQSVRSPSRHHSEGHPLQKNPGSIPEPIFRSPPIAQHYFGHK
ncbi:hypothetical protein EVA_16646 [gut metagenome]|uniref:Uncharacterized protein n=1 Tax=gut metagenome TaxID=749906 RepID=J9FLE2_9ZZZZ